MDIEQIIIFALADKHRIYALDIPYYKYQCARGYLKHRKKTEGG